MRRNAIAACALLAILPLLAGCGGGKAANAQEARAFVLALATSIVENDKEKIALSCLDMAGLGDNAVAARDWDNPGGKERIKENRRRELRLIMRDAGIEKTTDVDRLGQALKVAVQGKQAEVTFEIAGGEKTAAELVILRVLETDMGWKLSDYERKMIR